jgi:hypothetical protein
VAQSHCPTAHLWPSAEEIRKHGEGGDQVDDDKGADVVPLTSHSARLDLENMADHVVACRFGRVLHGPPTSFIAAS